MNLLIVHQIQRRDHGFDLFDHLLNLGADPYLHNSSSESLLDLLYIDLANKEFSLTQLKHDENIEKAIKRDDIRLIKSIIQNMENLGAKSFLYVLT